MRFTVCILFFVAACSPATWSDTFRGKSSRVVEDAGVTGDASSVAQQCAGLAASKPTADITVTFPGHGTPTETIHIVSGSSSCDLNVDTDTDGILFVGDALPCASLLAPGTPSSATATGSGSTSPTDLIFQWSYSLVCAIDDDYTLGKQ